SLYKESVAWQKCPTEKIDQALAAYDQLKAAYRSRDAAEFERASREFFDVLQRIGDASLAEGLALHNEDRPAVKSAYEKVTAAHASGEKEAEAKATDAFFTAAKNEGVTFTRYPGSSTLGLELAYNRVQPFMWAWIIMLPAILFFGVSLAMRWLGSNQPSQ